MVGDEGRADLLTAPRFRKERDGGYRNGQKEGDFEDHPTSRRRRPRLETKWGAEKHRETLRCPEKYIRATGV